MLHGYFDETGTNPKTDVALVLGGFLGINENWRLASDAWNKCLNRVPAVPHFSHRKCRSEEKLFELATVISQFPLTGYCMYIRHKSMVSRNASSMKGVAGSRPYDWVFRLVVETVLEHVGRFHPTERVDFTFDNRNELKACIPVFYEQKEEDAPCYRYAGKCEPGDDKTSPPLQMADLLVGEFNRCKQTGRLSEPLRLIINANGLCQGECVPPAAMNSLMTIENRSEELQKEFIDFFLKTKNLTTDELPHDLAVHFHELRQKSAFNQQQILQHNKIFKPKNNPVD